MLEPKYAKPFFEENFMESMEEEKDYYYSNEKLIVVDKALEKAVNKEMLELKDFIGTDDFLEIFNKATYNDLLYKLVKVINVNKWSFEATSFYHENKHELHGVDFSKYNITEFSRLPEEPRFTTNKYGKRTWKRYHLSRICGTVLDRNDTNGLVDILTTDLRVVTLKINKGVFRKSAY